MQIQNQTFKVQIPREKSHKGQNGKLLIIGGSELFHAASKWSLDVAARFVDMVFYCSIPSNNELVHEAKQHFWEGIIVPRADVLDYVAEADCILIGPGMTRAECGQRSVEYWQDRQLSELEALEDTQALVNTLLAQFPEKKWVIDAGALQMVEPKLLTQQCILTPHGGEFERLLECMRESDLQSLENKNALSGQIGGATVLLKSEVDTVFDEKKIIEIVGGSPGMTKGGTGDVLAGLVAALYASNDAWTAAVVGSFVNKKAGERLHKSVGPFFNSTDLVRSVSEVFWQLLEPSAQ